MIIYKYLPSAGLHLIHWKASFMSTQRILTNSLQMRVQQKNGWKSTHEYVDYQIEMTNTYKYVLSFIAHYKKCKLLHRLITQPYTE